MSDPGPTHQPYGQDPYGQQPGGQPYPYGQQSPYSQQPYGQQPGGDRRPGTVTAAAWITIVLSAITAALFGFTGLGLVMWAIIAIVLAVLVMRRSNVARILLVISSAVVALFSLLGVTSGVSAITLVAAIAVIVLLFVGGAGDWFKGL